MKKYFFLLKLQFDKTTIFHCKMTLYKNNNEITEMCGEKMFAVKVRVVRGARTLP